MFHRRCFPLAFCVLVTCLMPAFTAGLNKKNVMSESKGLTCWTCPNRTDNEACNDWAPDVNCPQGKAICKTIHVFDIMHRRSVRVRKMCATVSTCGDVGCREVGLNFECIACCDKSYCNQGVPVNETTAVLTRTQLHKAKSHAVTWPATSFPVLVIISLLLNFPNWTLR